MSLAKWTMFGSAREFFTERLRPRTSTLRRWAWKRIFVKWSKAKISLLKKWFQFLTNLIQLSKRAVRLRVPIEARMLIRWRRFQWWCCRCFLVVNILFIIECISQNRIKLLWKRKGRWVSASIAGQRKKTIFNLFYFSAVHQNFLFKRARWGFEQVQQVIKLYRWKLNNKKFIGFHIDFPITLASVPVLTRHCKQTNLVSLSIQILQSSIN